VRVSFPSSSTWREPNRKAWCRFPRRGRVNPRSAYSDGSCPGKENSVSAILGPTHIVRPVPGPASVARLAPGQRKGTLTQIRVPYRNRPTSAPFVGSLRRQLKTVYSSQKRTGKDGKVRRLPTLTKPAAVQSLPLVRPARTEREANRLITEVAHKLANGQE